MIKRILVPTDFSKPSQASYSFAWEMARSAKAEIFVVHVLEVPLLPETTFGLQPYPADKAMIEKLEDQAEEAFREMTKDYPQDVPVNFKTIQDVIIPGLKTFVEQNNIDLVVMSTHGASGLEEFMIGSKAEKIARFSPVPILAIPKETSFSSVKSIVLASTLELNQQDVVQRLKAIQSIFNATLHVLTINTPSNFHSDQELKEMLERFARFYELENFTLNHRNNAHERTGIISFMNEINADMVAVATHGRKGLAHLLKGSIAESVLNHIDKPIWTGVLSDR